MERLPVKSSNIKSIGYDEVTKTLEVEFTNRGVYQYKEVPKDIYEGFSKAESIGKYFAKNVKAKGFTYLKLLTKEQILDEIDYENAKDVMFHTYHNCSCGRGPCRNIRCARCWEEKLKEITK
jgi:hypothetical protein